MKKYIFRLILNTVTPVSIGNDEADKLSPLCDFIIRNNTVHYLDNNKIARMVQEKHLINDYVRGAASIDNTQTSFVLERFLRERAGVDPLKYVKESHDFRGPGRGKIIIRTLYRSGESPVITGSTIKGCIKTSLLYYWLMNSDEGREKLNDLIKTTESYYEKNKGLIKDVESVEHEIDVLSGQIRKYSKKDHAIKAATRAKIESRRRVLETAKDNLAAGRKGLEEKIDKVIDELFYIDDFKNLRVTDSEKFSRNVIVVCEIKRLHLIKGTLNIPQYVEAIKENSHSEFEVTIIPGFRQKEFSFMNNGDLKKLFEILNYFSDASVNTDWDMLDDNYKNFEKDEKSREIYNGLFDSYEKLNTDISKVRENNSAFIRLGFGKTFFDNSIGLAIYRTDKEALMKYVKLMQLGKPMQKIFPVTRSVCTSNFLPMGWVDVALK